MTKKLIALAIALPLLLAGPAAVAGKKAPKPYKSEEVTIAVPHPVLYGQSGAVNTITAKEFEQSCAIPSSNGLDAYVFEVPKEYKNVQAQISAIGTAATPAGYDLDIYLYDASCKTTFAINAEGTDESGIVPKGTAFILIHNYVGEPGLSAHIELEPYKASY
ncbi:MAG: extracellular elastinolytic metalloproteinase [Actinomycetota bacterium]|jgi:hypothetical protein|nr:extracellular elastinolytic metalloproteinase [Actinomycetota bacterium]